MKYSVEILNVMKYVKDGKSHTRLAYYFTDDTFVSETNKFKGYQENAFYFDGEEVFDMIKKDMLKKPAKFVVKDEPNPNNPFKTRKTLEKIEVNGTVLNLV